MNLTRFASVCLLVGLWSCGDPSTSPAAPSVPETDAFGIRWASVRYDSLRDTRDGQGYRTVHIGSQTWMAQNLNYAVDSSWCPAGSSDSCRKYGRLYHWSTSLGLPDSCDKNICSTLVKTRGRQGICPAGWKIPSDSEWQVLLAGVSSTTPGKFLKSQDGWVVGNGTDVHGFRVLPGGDRTNLGTYSMIDSASSFWSSGETTAVNVQRRTFSAYASTVSRVASYKSHGFSVRCIQGAP